MKLIYISGPYGDRGGYLSIDRNIAKAREAAAWLASNGVGYLCPHLNSAHFEAIVPEVPVEFWYEMDLALMTVCDGLLLLDGWDKSAGTQRELAEWDKTAKPVFMPDERAALLAWVSYGTNSPVKEPTPKQKRVKA